MTPKINVGFISMLVAVLGIAPMGTAYAATNCTGGMCLFGATDIMPTNCKTMSSGSQYGDYCLYSCNTCKDGYTKVVVIEKLTGCRKSYNDCTPDSGGGDDDDEGGGGIINPDLPFFPIDPDEPLGECNLASDCGKSTWTNVSGTNYQRRYTYTCLYPGTVRSKCESSASYRCQAGYYGSSTSCSPCPSPTDTLTSGSVTSAAGTTAVTGCYVKSGSVLKDSAGNTYDFTADCSYSN